jgi:hypothetical protein
MQRTTRKDVEQVYKVFCNVYGFRMATDYKDTGGLILACEGSRYQVRQIVGTSGHSNVLGNTMRNAASMVDAMQFAIGAYAYKTRE